MEYFKADEKDMDSLMAIRLEMLRIVNDLPENYEFDEKFVRKSMEYFWKGDQTTILAKDGAVVGCATLCYLNVMPTFSHPTGKRAHLMNVYTNASFRRQGIAKNMICMLMKEAKERGVTEISLDATSLGRPLYETLGFMASEEGMVFTF